MEALEEGKTGGGSPREGATGGPSAAAQQPPVIWMSPEKPRCATSRPCPKHRSLVHWGATNSTTIPPQSHWRTTGRPPIGSPLGPGVLSGTGTPLPAPPTPHSAPQRAAHLKCFPGGLQGFRPVCSLEQTPDRFWMRGVHCALRSCCTHTPGATGLSRALLTALGICP